jgi:hypothetical protein
MLLDVFRVVSITQMPLLASTALLLETYARPFGAITMRPRPPWVLLSRPMVAVTELRPVSITATITAGGEPPVTYAEPFGAIAIP